MLPAKCAVLGLAQRTLPAVQTLTVLPAKSVYLGPVQLKPLAVRIPTALLAKSAVLGYVPQTPAVPQTPTVPAVKFAALEYVQLGPAAPQILTVQLVRFAALGSASLNQPVPQMRIAHLTRFAPLGYVQLGPVAQQILTVLLAKFALPGFVQRSLPALRTLTVPLVKFAPLDLAQLRLAAVPIVIVPPVKFAPPEFAVVLRTINVLVGKPAYLDPVLPPRDVPRLRIVVPARSVLLPSVNLQQDVPPTLNALRVKPAALEPVLALPARSAVRASTVSPELAHQMAAASTRTVPPARSAILVPVSLLRAALRRVSALQDRPVTQASVPALPTTSAAPVRVVSLDLVLLPPAARLILNAALARSASLLCVNPQRDVLQTTNAPPARPVPLEPALALLVTTAAPEPTVYLELARLTYPAPLTTSVPTARPVMMGPVTPQRAVHLILSVAQVKLVLLGSALVQPILNAVLASPV